jgi:hypothetical protein
MDECQNRGWWSSRDKLERRPEARLKRHPAGRRRAEGLTVSEREPGGKAAQEIDQLWQRLDKDGFV